MDSSNGEVVHRTVLILLLVVAFSTGGAGPAYAADWVEGEMYRFRLPAGFEELDISEMADGEEAARALDMFDDMFSSHVDADFDLFVRKEGGQPKAFLGAMGFEFKGRMAQMAAGQMNLDQIEAQLKEALAQPGLPIEDATVRRISVGAGTPAVELEVTQYDENLKDMARARMLIVADEKAMVTLMFQGLLTEEASDAAVWRSVVTSFRMDGRSGFLRLLLRYGPFVLGGIVLLFAVSLFRNAGGGRGNAGPLPPLPSSERGAHPAGAGLSRAMDGLPTYGAEAAPPGSEPAPLPGLAPVEASAPPPVPAGAPRVIPKARTAPAYPGAPDPAPAPVAAGVGAAPTAPPSSHAASLPPAGAGRTPPLGTLGRVPGAPPVAPPMPPAPLAGARPAGGPPPLPSSPFADDGQQLPTNVARRSPSVTSSPGRDAEQTPSPHPAQGLSTATRPEAPVDDAGLKIQRNADFQAG